MSIRKILVLLVVGMALVGLTGAASTFDMEYYSDFSSYSRPSTDYSSPSVYESYEPTVSLEVNYFSAYNGAEISGSVIDPTLPYQITESIPFGTGTFSFSAFSSYWP